jgi:hypothetical protein
MNPPETAAKPEPKKVNIAAKPRKPAAAQPRVAQEAHAAWARIDQARIDKWIRDRLVDWCDSCWTCRAARHSA